MAQNIPHFVKLSGFFCCTMKMKEKRGDDRDEGGGRRGWGAWGAGGGGGGANKRHNVSLTAG